MYELHVVRRLPVTSFVPRLPAFFPICKKKKLSVETENEAALKQGYKRAHTHTHTHTHTQISAGIRHAVCSDCPLPERGVTSLAVPSSIPAEYSALKEVSCRALHARLLLLNHFAKLMISSWRLFSTQGGKVSLGLGQGGRVSLDLGQGGRVSLDLGQGGRVGW